MEKIISREEFEKKGKGLVFKEGAKQILVTEVKGQFFALDNRCPHEGYPLHQGDINSQTCVLTCNWHNWKFDLKTGVCLVGGDDVRTYPVKVDAQSIRVDLREQDPETMRNSLLSNLEKALQHRRYGQMSRETARLMFHGHDPLWTMKKAIFWSHTKLEFGTTHAYAATADWLALYKMSSDREDRLICLTEALDHMALDALRHRDYPFHQSRENYSEEELADAVEREDIKRAEGLVGQAMENRRFSDLEHLFSRLALAHYNDFGHSLIYVVKSRQLCDSLNDADIDRYLALSLVRHLCYTTREDLLPEFKKYKSTVEALEQSSFGESTFDDDFSLPTMNISESYTWSVEHQKTHSISSLFQVLLRSAADNLLHCNTTYQENPNHPVAKSRNLNWFSFTHAVTFANAVHRTCTKYPDLWPKSLAQMMSFHGRNSPFRDESVDEKDWIPDEYGAFEKWVKEKILNHGHGPPIYSAHLLKTAMASLEEARCCDARTRNILYGALGRFFQSPIRQKNPRRTAIRSIELISKDF